MTKLEKLKATWEAAQSAKDVSKLAVEDAWNKCDIAGEAYDFDITACEDAEFFYQLELKNQQQETNQ
jgi:hypothetical protein